MTRVAQQYVCTPCHWMVQLNMAKIMFYIMRLLPHTHIHTKHLKQMWWNGSPIIFFSFPIYLQTNSSVAFKIWPSMYTKNLYNSASNFYISQLLILTLQEKKKCSHFFSPSLIFILIHAFNLSWRRPLPCLLSLPSHKFPLREVGISSTLQKGEILEWAPPSFLYSLSTHPHDYVKNN